MVGSNSWKKLWSLQNVKKQLQGIQKKEISLRQGEGGWPMFVPPFACRSSIPTTVDANSQKQDVVGPMANLKLLYARKKFEGHWCYLPSMLIAVTSWKATNHHVSIPNCLHFVDIVVFDNPVKQCVQIVQHINNLRQKKFFFLLLLFTQVK